MGVRWTKVLRLSCVLRRGVEGVRRILGMVGRNFVSRFCCPGGYESGCGGEFLGL